MLIHPTDSDNVIVCTGNCLPPELDANRLTDLMIASLPAALDDAGWPEWDKFKYLRDQLHERLHDLAVAALGQPETPSPLPCKTACSVSTPPSRRLNAPFLSRRPIEREPSRPPSNRPNDQTPLRPVSAAHACPTNPANADP